jgi:hypothetical protein
MRRANASAAGHSDRGRPLGRRATHRRHAGVPDHQPGHENSKVFGSVRNDDWTFHLGGRDELQFNLGFESDHEKGSLRYGVAFSLETSRSLLDIAPLLKKLAFFNDYLRQILRSSLTFGCGNMRPSGDPSIAPGR